MNNKGIIIQFINIDQLIFICDTNGDKIWNSIIDILKKMDIIPNNATDEYKEKYFISIVEELNKLFKLYTIKKENIKDIDYNLIIDMCYYSSNKIEMFIKNKNNIILKSKIWDCNKLTGNCVDRFIRNKIISKINFIDNICRQINERNNERIDVIEYHQTSCYENDYLQLALMRDEAKKIMEECQNKLFALSEKYTKID